MVQIPDSGDSIGPADTAAPPDTADSSDTTAADSGLSDTDTSVDDSGPDIVDSGSPTTCAAAAQCPADTICAIDRSMPDADGGTCRSNTPGNRGGGSNCQQDDQCTSNLCLNGRFGPHCATPCQEDGDCSTSDFECRPTDVDTPNGQRNIDLCVRKPPPSCSEPSDCSDGETTCAIVLEADGTDFESVCIPDPNAGAPGSSCQRHTDCSSRLCFENTCTTPCVDNEPCPPDSNCRPRTINKAGQTTSLDICSPPTKCRSSADCDAPDYLCSAVETNGGTAETFCRPPNSSAPEKLGEFCMGNRYCKSGLCLYKSSQNRYLPEYCSVACRQDGDCAPGQVCATPNPNQDTLGFCMNVCETHNDCTSFHTCTLQEDRMTSPYSIDQVCIVEQQGGTFGDACDNAGCQSDLCLTYNEFRPNHSNNKSCSPSASQCASGWTCAKDPARGNSHYCAEVVHRCSRPCKTKSDCPSGPAQPLTACKPLQMNLSDGTRTSTNVCQVP